VRRTICLGFLLLAACATTSRERPAQIPSTPVETTGSIARQLLAAKGFTWTSFQTTHVRIHLSSTMNAARIDVIADSVENARRVVLALVDEPELPEEDPLELFLVETREDMRRLLGQPVTGTGYPSELTAVLVAGDGYRPFYRHQMTHTYVAHRWGRRRAGSWLDEGLATRATVICQGHAIDEIAAGYLKSGATPSLAALTSATFDSLPELPANFSAASLVDFFQHRKGTDAVRALWRGEASEATPEDPLGPETASIWSSWRGRLGRMTPATLSPNWLRQDGC
jgi:hypothetical protein